MRLRFSKAARHDLQTIYRQGHEMFGRKQADAYSMGLAAAFRLIADYPLSARERLETVRPVRARACRSHVILYTVEQAGVLVLRVRHGQEDWQADPVIPVDDSGDKS